MTCFRFSTFHKIFPIIFLPLFAFVLFHCGRKENPEKKEIILARIGDRIITQNEFLRRAEYTIRPAYCSGDGYIHKKIVLNSLIAEKLLALEAGDNNELMQNEDVRLYLQGRKEQAMRQWSYYKEGFEKVELDDDEIKNVYDLAGRSYKLAYFSVNDAALAERVRKEIQTGKSFEDSHRAGGTLAQIAEREVAYEAPESKVIHEALFSSELKKDQILGPLKVEDGSALFLKIEGWTDHLAISDAQIQRRWQDVSQRLTESMAEDVYDEYIGKLMRGKRLEFDPSTFRKIVNIVGPYYLKSSDEKKTMFNKQLWNADDNTNMMASMGNQLDAILDAPLFRIDGQIWTVRDLEKEMKIHPLVFRKRQLSKRDFAEQFKLAVVDMVRDRYITKDAYEKGYDREETVQRSVETWKDNLLALYQQNKFLKNTGQQENFNTEYLKIVENTLNPYVDSLQAKYAPNIEINTTAFENVKLTSVDMMVIQRNVPFPIVVPGFPVLTTDHALDYGRTMK